MKKRKTSRFFTMAPVVAVLCLIVYALCRKAQPLPHEDGCVRVATWNLKWFPSGTPLKPGEPVEKFREKARISSVARFIRHEEADVVLLQEVRNREVLDALVAHEALAGFTVNAISDFTSSGRIPAHQNVIISRYKTVCAGSADFQPNGGIRPPRGFVWAVLDTGEKLIGVVVIHLKSNLLQNAGESQGERAMNMRKREEAARQVLAFANGLKEYTFEERTVSDVIIGGDLNTSFCDPAYAGERTFDLFNRAGFSDMHGSLPRRKRHTLRNEKHPPAIFDYLFHCGSSDVKNPRVAIQHYTSDHSMVIADLGRE